MHPMTRFNTDKTTDFRQQLWLALLVVATLGTSYIFACAAAFTALAVVAALTLNRSNAVMFILAAWLANQVVGYGILGYPQNMVSYGWGLVIGAAALVALFVARATSRIISSSAPEVVRIAACFGAAFIGNQLFMLLATLTPLGGIGGFSLDIVGQVFVINLVAMVAIYAANMLAVSAGFLPSNREKAAI